MAHHHGQPNRGRLSGRRRQTAVGYRGSEPGLVGDITYLRTWERWLYLATVIDAHSRRVIGWAIADHMRTDLIQDALIMAMALCGERPEQVIFLSDCGTKYASAQITAFAKAHRITRSMGSTGVCWDNAMAESFFATLQTEFYHRRV
ncbi:DDE domain-containing protein [Cryobacterium sp. Hz7]|nr:DDE domain-containing protein [Cryobacterium sp. Hz7]